MSSGCVLAFMCNHFFLSGQKLHLAGHKIFRFSLYASHFAIVFLYFICYTVLLDSCHDTLNRRITLGDPLGAPRARAVPVTCIGYIVSSEPKVTP